MVEILDVIYRRRAVKVFEPVEISDGVRERILDAARYAPSSFNLQPYKFYWVQTAEKKRAVARLCMGQKPAETASALVVAVADIGALAATSKSQAEWMRGSGFTAEEIREYERAAKIGRVLFMPGPLGLFAAVKRAVFWVVNLRRVIGMPPLFRQEIFKWAARSTSLACQNLMIAAEALGMSTCPMEGFDGRRLGRYLGLSRRKQEVVMVIAVGKRSSEYRERPQWRRPLETTVVEL